MVDERLRGAAAHVLVANVEAIELDDEGEHHLRRVLRIRSGQTVTITDGAGSWRECTWTGNHLEVVGPTMFVERPKSVAIAVAIPKQDRPDWMVAKLVECGVDRIVLLHAARSVVRWESDRVERHLDRLERISRSALEQSRSVYRCDIEGPVEASSLLPTAVVAEPGGRQLEPSDAVVAIGPEGGWTPEEVVDAAGSVDLGDRVLRVETAALVAALRMIDLRR